jgi:hypothetical protein
LPVQPGEDAGLDYLFLSKIEGLGILNGEEPRWPVLPPTKKMRSAGGALIYVVIRYIKDVYLDTI